MSEFEQDFTQIFMRGICLISEGEYEEAVGMFDQVIDMEPTCADAYSQRGYAKFQLDRHNESLEDLNRAIEISPQSVDAFAFRARTHWVAGNHQQAFDDVTYALELDPDNEHALHVRAYINMEIENYAGAINDFNHILDQSPDDQHALLMRAWAKMSCGQPGEALTDNDLLLEADPYDARTLLQRAAVFLALERYEDALASASDAIREHYDGQRSPQYFMGWALLALGRYDEAVTRFGEAFEAEKTSLTLYGTAVALGRLGKTDECRDTLSEAARLAGESGETVNERYFLKRLRDFSSENADSLCLIETSAAIRYWYEALAAREAEDYEKALNLFGEALKRDPILPGAYYNIATIYYQELDRYDEAQDAIDMALELNPDEENYIYRKGMILIARECFQEAFDLYTAMIEKSTDVPAPYYQRGRARYAMQDLDGAIEDLNVFCQSEPNNETALMYLAGCLEEAKQFDKAVENYSRVIYYYPGHVGALHYRAVIYEEELEKYEEAIRDETQVIETNAEFSPAFVLRGRAWGSLSRQAQWAKGKGEKLSVTLTGFFPQEYFDANECLRLAIDDLTKALELDPESLQAIWFRGYFRYRNEDHLGAIEDFRRLIEQDQTVLSAYYWMGWAFRSLGKFQDAVDAFDKALAVNPDDGETLYARGMAKQCLFLFAEAEQDLKKASELDPDDAWAVHYYAHTLEWQGRFEESLAHYAQAMEMNSETVEWYCCYADVLIKLGRTEEAVELLNASIAIDPHQSQPYFYLGELYDGMGERDKAVEFYQLAIRSEDPALRSSREDADINLTYRGKAFAGLGQHEEAVERYLEAMKSAKTPELQERDRQSHAWWLAESHYALGRFVEALELYRVGLEYLLIYHDRKERIARCRDRIAKLEAGNFGL